MSSLGYVEKTTSNIVEIENTLDVSNRTISNVGNPVNNSDVATKEYVDSTALVMSNNSVINVDAGAADGGDGTLILPFNNIQDAIDAAQNENKIYINSGTYVGTYILPRNKSLYFEGASNVNTILIASETWSDTNGDIFYIEGGVNAAYYSFKNFTFANGKYAIHALSGVFVEVDKCLFNYNGWNGSGISFLDVESGEVLGYDSSQVDLQNFYASSAVSDGGAIKLENIYSVSIITCEFYYNNRTITLVDCGAVSIDVKSNIIVENIISLELLSSTGDSTGGCSNSAIYLNLFQLNGSDALHIQGGQGNIVILNIAELNWNSDCCVEYSSTVLVDKNHFKNGGRSLYGANGVTAGSLAAISIGGDNIASGSKYIAKLIDNVIDRSNSSPSESRGIELRGDLSEIVDPLYIYILENNINNMDVGLKFLVGSITNQISTEQVGLVIHSRNTYANNVKNIENLDGGNYFELPFSNTYANENALDFRLDIPSQSVVITGNGNTYSVGQLKAVGHGDGTVTIIEKQSNDNRIQHDKIAYANMTIDSASAGGDEATVVNTLNALFNNSGNGVPSITSVTSFSATESESVNFTVTADNSPTIYSLGNLVSGLGIVFNTGQIVGVTPEYKYNDNDVVLTGGETTVTSASAFDADGANLQVAIDQANNGSLDIALVLGVDYTINSTTEIALSGGGAYALGVSGDSVRFRIGDNSQNNTDLQAVVSNNYGLDSGTLTFKVLYGAASTIVPVLNNTKSIYVSTNEYMRVTTPSTHPLNRVGSGAGASDAWTIVFWFNAWPSGGERRAFGATNNTGSAASPNIYISVNSSQVTFNYGSSSNNIQLTHAGNYRDDHWHMMAITYDGNTTSPATDGYTRFKLYINGSEVVVANSNAGDGISGGMAVSRLTVGDFWTTTNEFEGYIDEFSVYNKELSSAEIVQMFNGGRPMDLNYSTAGQPDNWWRCGDGGDSHPNISDFGTRGETLVMYNMGSWNIENFVPGSGF